MWALENYYFEIAKLLLKYKPQVCIQDKVVLLLMAVYNVTLCVCVCVCTGRVVSVGAGQ